MIPVHGAMLGNVNKITGLKYSKGSFLLMKVHMILTLKQRGWRDGGITLQFYFSSVSLIFIMYLKFPPDSAMLDAFVRQDAFIDLLFACDVLKMKMFFYDLHEKVGTSTYVF